MSNAKHSQQTPAQGIHAAFAYTYANEAARLAATGFTADDTYKLAMQLDDFTQYILTNHSPITWKDVGNAAVNGDLNKVQIHCRKNSAGTLPVGTVVYGVGYNHTSDYALVEKAKADSESTMPAIGVVNVEVSDTVTGSYLVVGVVHMDTSSWGDGDCLYVSASVAGQMTNTAPSGPNEAQRVASVLESAAVDGHLQVFVGSCRHHNFVADPQPIGTADPGTSNLSSPSDHVHAHGDQGGGSLHAAATTGTAGFMSAADKTKLDSAAVLSDTAPENVTKAAASAGVATEASRRDHKHDISTATASAQAPGDSASEGSATSLARSDHKHSLPGFGATADTFCEGNDSRLSDARTPTAHSTTHQSGGSDTIKLDDLATPDDNTDLDATTSYHGLLKKLSGVTTEFLRGDGSWATPGGSSPLTTKGDLHGYDTADARIPVGSNGQVLTADSTQSLGVKWATPKGYTLPFGGNGNNTGRYFAANGYHSYIITSSLNQQNQHVVPASGTITAVAYITESGTTSTVIKIHINGVVQATFNLDGSEGVESVSVAVSAGDRVAIEYDGGSNTDYSIWSVYIE